MRWIGILILLAVVALLLWMGVEQTRSPVVTNETAVTP